jgi:hypothetical protein
MNSPLDVDILGKSPGQVSAPIWYKYSLLDRYVDLLGPRVSLNMSPKNCKGCIDLTSVDTSSEVSGVRSPLSRMPSPLSVMPRSNVLTSIIPSTSLSVRYHCGIFSTLIQNFARASTLWGGVPTYLAGAQCSCTVHPRPRGTFNMDSHSTVTKPGGIWKQEATPWSLTFSWSKATTAGLRIGT